MPVTKNNLLLWILPLATLVLCLFVIVERNPFHSSWSDPTFCYLFNGLNIAIGYFKVGQVDHPGTPLQIFAGACIRFFHLFSSEDDVVKDVVLRPQWYLFRICILQSIIIAFCMQVAGWLMYRFSSNIAYGLLIQLTHLISFQALFFSQNLMTEFVLVVTGLLLAPFLVAYTFFEKDNGFKKIVGAGLICGTMLAGKISSFPIILLWLLIVKSWKHFFVFSILFSLSFLIWTIPAWHASSFFINWLANITTHTGVYGSGEKGFVIWDQFFSHLRFLLTDNRFFSFTLILILVVSLQTLFPGSRKKWLSKSALRSLLVIAFVSLLQLVMVSKHFGAHYIIPIHLLVVPVWIIILMDLFQGKILLFFSNRQLAALAVMLLGVFLFIKQIMQYNFYPNFEQPSLQLMGELGERKYDATLFMNTITAPLPQAALYFGVNYAGDCTGDYKRMLEREYPPFFYFNVGKDTLTSWTKEIPAAEALNDSLIYYLYSPASNFDVNQLSWANGKIKPDTILFSYHHPTSGGSAYLLKFKTH